MKKAIYVFSVLLVALSIGTNYVKGQYSYTREGNNFDEYVSGLTDSWYYNKATQKCVKGSTATVGTTTYSTEQKCKDANKSNVPIVSIPDKDDPKNWVPIFYTPPVKPEPKVTTGTPFSTPQWSQPQGAPSGLQGLSFFPTATTTDKKPAFNFSFNDTETKIFGVTPRENMFLDNKKPDQPAKTGLFSFILDSLTFNKGSNLQVQPTIEPLSEGQPATGYQFATTTGIFGDEVLTYQEPENKGIIAKLLEGLGIGRGVDAPVATITPSGANIPGDNSPILDTSKIDSVTDGDIVVTSGNRESPVPIPDEDDESILKSIELYSPTKAYHNDKTRINWAYNIDNPSDIDKYQCKLYYSEKGSQEEETSINNIQRRERWLDEEFILRQHKDHEERYSIYAQVVCEKVKKEGRKTIVEKEIESNKLEVVIYREARALVSIDVTPKSVPVGQPLSLSWEIGTGCQNCKIVTNPNMIGVDRPISVNKNRPTSGGTSIITRNINAPNDILVVSLECECRMSDKDALSKKINVKNIKIENNDRNNPGGAVEFKQDLKVSIDSQLSPVKIRRVVKDGILIYVTDGSSSRFDFDIKSNGEWFANTYGIIGYTIDGISRVKQKIEPTTSKKIGFMEPHGQGFIGINEFLFEELIKSVKGDAKKEIDVWFVQCSKYHNSDEDCLKSKSDDLLKVNKKFYLQYLASPEISLKLKSTEIKETANGQKYRHVQVTKTSDSMCGSFSTYSNPRINITWAQGQGRDTIDIVYKDEKDFNTNTDFVVYCDSGDTGMQGSFSHIFSVPGEKTTPANFVTDTWTKIVGFFTGNNEVEEPSAAKQPGKGAIATFFDSIFGRDTSVSTNVSKTDPIFDTSKITDGILPGDPTLESVPQSDGKLPGKCGSTRQEIQESIEMAVKANNIKKIEECVKEWPGSLLFVSDAEAISKEAAEALTKGNAESVVVQFSQGIEWTNREAAEALTKGSITLLAFDGLKSINKDVARNLTRGSVVLLTFPKITSITSDIAEVLASGSTRKLSFNSLETITSNVARNLTRGKVEEISLRALSSIDNTTAIIFAEFEARGGRVIVLDSVRKTIELAKEKQEIETTIAKVLVENKGKVSFFVDDEYSNIYQNSGTDGDVILYKGRSYKFCLSNINELYGKQGYLRVLEGFSHQGTGKKIYNLTQTTREGSPVVCFDYQAPRVDRAEKLTFERYIFPFKCDNVNYNITRNKEIEVQPGTLASDIIKQIVATNPKFEWHNSILGQTLDGNPGTLNRLVDFDWVVYTKNIFGNWRAADLDKIIKDLNAPKKNNQPSWIKVKLSFGYVKKGESLANSNNVCGYNQVEEITLRSSKLIAQPYIYLSPSANEANIELNFSSENFYDYNKNNNSIVLKDKENATHTCRAYFNKKLYTQNPFKYEILKDKNGDKYLKSYFKPGKGRYNIHYECVNDKDQRIIVPSNTLTGINVS